MVPTPCNSAQKGDFAKVVLMPGDPMRSKWMADNYLEDAKLVNNIRGVQGYTGTWKGHPVSVMASGIGIASISLYAYELFNFYDVDLIIRTGTCGIVQNIADMGDIIIADRAYTTSNFLSQLGLPRLYVPRADREMLTKAVKASREVLNGKKYLVGSVLTEDLYYSQKNIVRKWAARGVLAFEMEAAALYANAKAAGKKALAVLTVSNNILDGREMDPMDRERSLTDMVEIALKAAFDE